MASAIHINIYGSPQNMFLHIPRASAIYQSIPRKSKKLYIQMSADWSRAVCTLAIDNNAVTQSVCQARDDRRRESSAASKCIISWRSALYILMIQIACLWCVWMEQSDAHQWSMMYSAHSTFMNHLLCYRHRWNVMPIPYVIHRASPIISIVITSCRWFRWCIRLTVPCAYQYIAAQ